MKLCDDCKRTLESLHAFCDEKKKQKHVLFHGKNMNNGDFSCWRQGDDFRNNCIRTLIEKLAHDDEKSTQENNLEETTAQKD